MLMLNCMSVLKGDKSVVAKVEEEKKKKLYIYHKAFVHLVALWTKEVKEKREGRKKIIFTRYLNIKYQKT